MPNPAEILLKELDKRALTVATAESCTGGNIAHLITLVPGSSSAMLGGGVVCQYGEDSCFRGECRCYQLVGGGKYSCGRADG